MCNCPDPRHDHPRRMKKGIDRRDLLKYVTGAAGIAALGPWIGKKLPDAFGAPVSQKRLVVIEMSGGCDTFSMIVPTNLTSYYSRRPNIAIPAASTIALAGVGGSAGYALHPSMPKIQALWNEGKAAFANRVGYPTENQSHFTSQDIYSYGVRNSFGPLGIQPSGWIARYADLYAATPMGAVAVGAGRPTAFVGGSSNPLQVGSVASFKFDGERSTYANNRTYQMKLIKDIIQAFPSANLPGEVRDAQDAALTLSDQLGTALTNYNLVAGNPVYANTGISAALRDVAAIINGGFSTNIFYTVFGGFDLHSALNDGVSKTTGDQAKLMKQLDDAIGAFAADMKNQGTWNDTVVCVITEFGRRNYENGSVGLDHGGAFTELVVGGAVSGGKFVGPDLSNSDISTSETLAYAVDFRDVYKEVINDHLGHNPAPVFPETQPINNSNLGLIP